MSTLAPPPRPAPSSARRRAASAAAGPHAAALRDAEPPHVAGADPCLCAMCHLRPTRFPRRLDGRIVLPDPLAAVRGLGPGPGGEDSRVEPRMRAGSFVQEYAGGGRIGEDRGEGPSSRVGGQWHGDAESRAWFERAGADSTPSAGPETAGDVRDAARARRTDGRQAVGEHSQAVPCARAELMERVLRCRCTAGSDAQPAGEP